MLNFSENGMKKGQLTRVAIIDSALDIAAREGLEGITIGSLADKLGMSKSGVFAHFGSREDLQIAVLKAYERRFIDLVLIPCLNQKRGLPRLQAIIDAWLERSKYEAENGCVWISSASEYDDRPGAVRDELVGMVHSWQRELTRTIKQCIESGDLHHDLDAEQLVFEIYGLILVVHHDARLLKSANAVVRARQSLQRLIASYSVDASGGTMGANPVLSVKTIRTDTAQILESTGSGHAQAA